MLIDQIMLSVVFRRFVVFLFFNLFDMCVRELRNSEVLAFLKT